MAYYPMTMHMHSIHEYAASMEGQLTNAARFGLRHAWITDHDTRMGPRKTSVHGFDFEGPALLAQDVPADPEGRLRAAIRRLEAPGITLDARQRAAVRNRVLAPVYQGFTPRLWGKPAACDAALSRERPHGGAQCLRLSATADESAVWQGVRADHITSGKRQQVALTSDVTLKLWLRVPEGGENLRVMFHVKLSQRPVPRPGTTPDFRPGKAPDFRPAQLVYLAAFGAEPGDGEELLPALTDTADGPVRQTTAILPLNLTAGGWQEVVLPISRDVPEELGGQDNVFGEFSLILLVKNGRAGEIYADDFQINARLAFESARQAQAELAKQIGARLGVMPFVATEISGIGGDMNCFSTRVPIIDYQARGFQVSREEAVDWVRRHGGICSKNHPLETYKTLSLNEGQRRKVLAYYARELTAAQVYGAGMLEVGFPEGRAGFSLEDYLTLWDSLSKAGIFVTGYGDSDSHSCLSGWDTGNNFCSWVWAGEDTGDPGRMEAQFTASMAAGRLFFADTARFRGTLEFYGQNIVMGQARRCAPGSRHSLRLRMRGGPPGTLRWTAAGDAVKTLSVGADWDETLTVTARPGVTAVRAALCAPDGRALALTNPIYLVTDEHMKIPPERLAPAAI